MRHARYEEYMDSGDVEVWLSDLEILLSREYFHSTSCKTLDSIREAKLNLKFSNSTEMLRSTMFLKIGIDWRSDQHARRRSGEH